MNVPRAFKYLVFGLLCLGLQSCWPQSESLRFGLNLWPAYELAYLAQEKGFYQAEGVQVRLLEFSTLSDTRRAFEMGHLDGMAGSLSEVLEARDISHRDLRILRVVDYSKGGDRVIARKAFRSLQALKGQTIGFEPSSLGLYVLVRALERQGMHLNEVEAVSLPPEQMEKALKTGQVKAVVTYAPYATQILRQPEFHSVFTSRQMEDDILDVFAFDAAVLQQNPQEIRAFLKAIDRAYAFFQDQPQAACRIMAQRENITGEEFCQSLQHEIQLIAPEQQAVYLGPQAKIKPILNNVYRIMRENKRISNKKEILDCLINF
jgi:NitT/TauT family transport system substrate-binding protein